MKSIFEIIDEKFDLKSEVMEVKNIFETVNLIEDTGSFGLDFNTNYTISLEDYIDKYNFRNWKYRGTCLTTKAFKEKIGISNLDKNSGEIEYIWYLEYVYNMLNIFLTDCIYDEITVEALKETIISILDKINITLKENDGKYIAIKKNVALDKVIKKLQKDVAYDFISYLNIGNTLAQKRSILKNIADYFEGIRTKYENSTIKFERDLISDTFYYFNNFNIRHNNNKGKKAKNELKNITNEELMEIYDEVFNNCLMLVLLEDYDDFEAKTKKYKEVI